MPRTSALWPFPKRAKKPEPSPPPAADPGAVPGQGRGVRILLGMAALVVVAFGMAAIGGILAPTLLALILTICVQPVGRWLVSRGTPAGLATGAVILVLFLLLAGFAAVMVIALAQFVTMLPTYSEQFQKIGADIGAWLESIGIGAAQVQDLTKGFDPTKLVSFFTGIARRRLRAHRLSGGHPHHAHPDGRGRGVHAHAAPPAGADQAQPGVRDLGFRPQRPPLHGRHDRARGSCRA